MGIEQKVQRRIERGLCVQDSFHRFCLCLFFVCDGFREMENQSTRKSFPVHRRCDPLFVNNGFHVNTFYMHCYHPSLTVNKLKKYNCL